MSVAKTEDVMRPCSAPVLSKELKSVKKPPKTATSPKTTPKSTKSKSNVSDQPAKGAKKKSIKNVLESPLTSTGSLDEKTTHKLGQIPAYLKKAQPSTKSPSEKDVKPAAISEHERAHQLCDRPTYLTRRAAATAANELKTKRDLFDKQRKQLECLQAQVVGTFNHLKELHEKTHNSTDKLEWTPELKILHYTTKKENRSHGDARIELKADTTIECLEKKLCNMQNDCIKLCLEFSEQSAKLFEATETQMGDESSVVAKLKDMMNTFHDKLSIEGENYTEQVKNILKELNHRSQMEEVTTNERKIGEQNKLLIGRVAEQTKEIEELKRRKKQDEKRAKEIDKNFHDICNENQKLQQEISQTNNDYANQSKRVKVLEKQVQKANEQIELQIKATDLKETTIKQLREDVASLERKVEALNVCVEQLRHANDRLEEDLQQRMIEANEYGKRLINEKAEVEVELELIRETLGKGRGTCLDSLQVNQNLVNQISIDPASKMTSRAATPNGSEEVVRLKQQLKHAIELMEHERALKLDLIDKHAQLNLCVDESDEVIKELTLEREREIKEEISKLKEQIESKDAELDLLRNSQDDNQRRLSAEFNKRLQAEVADKDNEIIEAKKTIAELQHQLTAMRLLVDEKQQELDNWRVNFNSDLEKYSGTAANNSELLELDELRKKLARKEALIQDFNAQMDSDKEKIRSLHADFRTHMKLLKIRGEVIKELEQKETSLRLELLAAKEEVEKCKRINSKIELYRETTANVEELENLFSTLGLQQIQLSREQKSKKMLQQHLMNQNQGRARLEQRIAELEHENEQLCGLLTEVAGPVSAVPSLKRMRRDDSPTKDYDPHCCCSHETLDKTRQEQYEEYRRLKRQRSITVRKYEG